MDNYTKEKSRKVQLELEDEIVGKVLRWLIRRSWKVIDHSGRNYGQIHQLNLYKTFKENLAIRLEYNTGGCAE